MELLKETIMAKTPTKTDEVTPEVKVVITETPTDAPAPKLSKVTVEEMEAGKKALAKHAPAK